MGEGEGLGDGTMLGSADGSMLGDGMGEGDGSTGGSMRQYMSSIINLTDFSSLEISSPLHI